MGYYCIMYWKFRWLKTWWLGLNLKVQCRNNYNTKTYVSGNKKRVKNTTVCMRQHFSTTERYKWAIYSNYLDYVESLNHSSANSPTGLISDERRVCLQKAQGMRLCVHAAALGSVSAPLNASVPQTVTLSLCSARSRLNAAHVAPAAAACHPTQGQRTFNTVHRCILRLTPTAAQETACLTNPGICH